MSDVQKLLNRVAHRVRTRRGALGLTARELAERSGLSPRFVSQLENGKANIAIGRLEAVAQVLGLELADLVASEMWQLRKTPTVLHDGGGTSYLDRRRERPVALLGMRGAGKSTIGELLADALRWPLIEVDHKIEDVAGMDVGRIFTVHGEEYYRRVEALCVGELLGRDEPMVIAPSGGVVGNGPAFGLIRERCLTVWLRAEPEEHMSRVLGQGDSRPVKGREQPLEELRAILARREALYSQADLVVDTSGGGAEATAEELYLALQALIEEQLQLAGG